MSWGLCCAQKRRLVLGVVVLLIVDVIWVASSELTVYVFVQQQYSKPFFSTFVKTSMFILYLLGFLFWKPWRQQCAVQQQRGISISDTDSHVTAGGTENGYNNCLSEPLYVPVKFQDVADNGVSRESKTPVRKQRVRFSNVMEVRELPHSQALEAKLSRMSHAATSLRIMGKRSVSAVAKISFFFCFVTSFSWLFFAGAVPVFLSFFLTALLSHYNNWDPAMVALRRVFSLICRKHRIHRLAEDSEQCESLIPLQSSALENRDFCS
ncbi:solute carrier family 35 member F5 isoform X2 [Tachysurus ichikawai]